MLGAPGGGEGTAPNSGGEKHGGGWGEVQRVGGKSSLTRREHACKVGVGVRRPREGSLVGNSWTMGDGQC